MATRAASATAIFDLADQVALVSSEVLKFRIKNRPSLGPDERKELEGIETKLDKATAKLRAAGISALGSITRAARLEVEAATKDAEKLLRRIRRVERAVTIATSVLGLALAVIDGDVQAIVAAVQEVKGTIDGDDA